MLERGSGGKRDTLRKRAYEYLHGVIISSLGGKPDFRRGEFSACYFAYPRYISAIVLSLGDFGTTRCAPIVPLSLRPATLVRANTPESLSAIFGALTPPDFLRARHINGLATARILIPEKRISPPPPPLFAGLP